MIIIAKIDFRNYSFQPNRQPTMCYVFLFKACSFSADGKLLASASDDQTVYLHSFLVLVQF